MYVLLQLSQSAPSLNQEPCSCFRLMHEIRRTNSRCAYSFSMRWDLAMKSLPRLYPVSNSFLRRHRAATTNSTAFINLLLHPPEELKLQKTRLNTTDRVGAYSRHP